MSQPDATGHFGPYGGRYVAETLVPALEELTAAWESAQADPDFQRQFQALLTDYVLPFEIVSVLLLVVLCGAAYIARRGKDEEASNA